MIYNQNGNSMNIPLDLKNSGKMYEIPKKYKDTPLSCLSDKIEKTKPISVVLRTAYCVVRIAILKNAKQSQLTSLRLEI